MNPQIKQKLKELTDLISKSKIEGRQNNGAVAEDNSKPVLRKRSSKKD